MNSILTNWKIMIEKRERKMSKFNLFVKYYNCNANKIEDYDVLKRRESEIKKLKKKCATKEEFAESLRIEFMWRFWSKSEWELIVTKNEDGCIILLPWCGSRDPKSASIDVTDDKSFDWSGFADEHIKQQTFKNQAKIDVYDQIMYGDRFSNLVDELWYTRLPYERDNPKFHR